MMAFILTSSIKVQPARVFSSLRAIQRCNQSFVVFSGARAWEDTIKYQRTFQRAVSTDGKGHDHSKLWSAERVVSAGLLGLIPTALAFPCAPLNFALALSLTLHAHWGLEAIVADYVRPSIFGKAIPKISLTSLYVASIAAFSSLCYFNYTDVGIAQAVHMLWSL